MFGRQRGMHPMDSAHGGVSVGHRLVKINTDKNLPRPVISDLVLCNGGHWEKKSSESSNLG